MDCAGCHEKPADQLKPGGATPAALRRPGRRRLLPLLPRGRGPEPLPARQPAGGRHDLPELPPHARPLPALPVAAGRLPAGHRRVAGLNPHGGKIFCLACHPDTPAAGAPPAFASRANPLRLCHRCHDGVEHHPLGVKSTPATWKMDFAHFPLENEAVTCVTCHEPPECRGGRRPREPPLSARRALQRARGVLRALPRGQEVLHAQPARPDRRERRDLSEEVPLLPRHRARAPAPRRMACATPTR